MKLLQEGFVWCTHKLPGPRLRGIPDSKKEYYICVQDNKDIFFRDESDINADIENWNCKTITALEFFKPKQVIL